MRKAAGVSAKAIAFLSAAVLLPPGALAGGPTAAPASKPAPVQSRPTMSKGEALEYLRQQVSPADIDWLRAATRRQLEGCRLRAHDGTTLFTPDGTGAYAALWTRDFAYMVEGAPDLFEKEQVRAAIVFLLKGQRADGCMPDRVTAGGKAVYAPGPENAPMADHALDNGPFMVKLVAAYVDRWGDLELFRQNEASLRRGLDFVRRGEDGLVYNDTATPQCPYGFTDTVTKTGRLLFTSLLYYEACRRMREMVQRAGGKDMQVYERRANLIRRNLGRLWDEKSGMFLAADRDCRQVDVWGSALAVDLKVTSDEQRDRILEFLIANQERIFKRGQVRHLPAPGVWSRTFAPVAPGTYQNGAYWATPHAWLLPALAQREPAMAARLLNETIADFRAHGINECVNDGYRNVAEYVASATNVYTLLRSEVRSEK